MVFFTSSRLNLGRDDQILVDRSVSGWILSERGKNSCVWLIWSVFLDIIKALRLGLLCPLTAAAM